MHVTSDANGILTMLCSGLGLAEGVITMAIGTNSF